MSEHAGYPEGITHESLFQKKASATRTFQIHLRKFFPPDDEYATCMARLCILREDLSMEINGIVAGPFDWLDSNGIPWRHNYFFRNFAKTIQEIASALQTLNCVPEFKRALKRRFTSSQQKLFKDFCKEIQVSGDLITEVRNSIGGHVKHSVVARGLKTIDFDMTGYWVHPFDQKDRLAHTHHPFVNDLVVAMIRAGDRSDHLPEKDITEALEIPGVMARLQYAIPHIDSLFALYVNERHLL